MNLCQRTSFWFLQITVTRFLGKAALFWMPLLFYMFVCLHDWVFANMLLAFCCCSTPLPSLLCPLPLAGLARRVSIYLDRSKQGGECCCSVGAKELLWIAGSFFVSFFFCPNHQHTPFISLYLPNNAALLCAFQPTQDLISSKWGYMRLL